MIKQVPHNQIATNYKSNHDTIAEPGLRYMIKKIFYKMYGIWYDDFVVSCN